MTNPSHTSRRRRKQHGHRRDDRGSIAVETAILSPAFMLLILLAIVLGRTDSAYTAVAVAAHDAARAASISSSEQTAAQQATTVAESTIANHHAACATLDIGVDAGQFSRPAGVPAVVTVTVTCQLTFTDLGLPLTRTLEVDFVSPIDTWRSRS